MRKDKLLKLLTNKKTRHSNILVIDLLRQFLETEAIKHLSNKENISFRSYLNFLQERYPDADVSDLFQEPLLNEQYDKEISCLLKFLKSESSLQPILKKNSIKYNFKTLYSLLEPASAIAVLPDGNMLTGTCYFGDNDYYCKGKIVLRDSTGNCLQTLSNEPASAIAILPNGNMLTSTCYFAHNAYYCRGKIILRDSTGNCLQILSNEPASAIAILPDGNMLTSTCYFSHDDYYCRGKIVLRDSTGNCLQTLSNEPASAIAILPNGNMLTSTCYFAHNAYYCRGKIILRDSTGNCLQILSNEPASAIAILPDGNMLTSTCYFSHDDYYCRGSISVTAPQLIAMKTPIMVGRTPLLQKINALVLDKATMSCLQFQKGYAYPTEDISLLCRLPQDILSIIYSYVFPFPNEKTNRIINSELFSHQLNKHTIIENTKEISLAEEFAKKIVNSSRFFSPPKTIPLQASAIPNKTVVIQEECAEKHKHEPCHIM